jgi:hypothetical protein
MSPEVTPPTAHSRDAAIDSRWRSMLRDRSKHVSSGAAILVTIRKVGTTADQLPSHQDAGTAGLQPPVVRITAMLPPGHSGL